MMHLSYDNVTRIFFLRISLFFKKSNFLDSKLLSSSNTNQNIHQSISTKCDNARDLLEELSNLMNTKHCRPEYKPGLISLYPKLW